MEGTKDYQEFKVNLNVEQVADYLVESTQIIQTELIYATYLVVKIDYPLDNPFTYRFFLFSSKLNELLTTVALLYKNLVYQNKEVFKVDSHDLSDLWFEGVKIYNNGNVEIKIGS